MNIDYAQIIEKANARKEALEAFAARMKEAPEQVRKLHDALVFFADLKAAANALDAEGLALVRHQADVAESFALPLIGAASTLSFQDTYGISRWSRFVDLVEGKA